MAEVKHASASSVALIAESASQAVYTANGAVEQVSAEQARAQVREDEIAALVSAARTRADDAFSAASIEAGRAQNAEQALTASISSEALRAAAKEQELESRIAALKSFDVVVADRLPSSGSANTVYLVPSAKSAAGNVRDEYLWVGGAWEQIGSTAVDLTDYAKKSEVPSSPDDIGAAAATHAESHATDGDDPISPSDIGIFVMVRSNLGMISRWNPGFSTIKIGGTSVDVVNRDELVEKTNVNSDLALYPYNDVEGGNLLDHKCNQGNASTTTYTLPYPRTDKCPRDFALTIDLTDCSDDKNLIIEPQSEEDAYSDNMVSIHPMSDDTFSIEAGVINEFYFHEICPHHFLVRRISV